MSQVPKCVRHKLNFSLAYINVLFGLYQTKLVQFKTTKPIRNKETVYDFALRNTLPKGTSCKNQEQGN